MLTSKPATAPLRSISRLAAGAGADFQSTCARTPFRRPTRRSVSTLQSNPNIYIFPLTSSSSSTPSSNLLTLLPTDPPTAALSLGTTTALPPTPSTFTENPHFHPILQSVVSRHATSDPEVQRQAHAFASQAGAGLGSQPGMPSTRTGRGGDLNNNRGDRRKRGGRARNFGASGGVGGGGASGQGGMGGAGVGGWVHVADQRNPPDWGRVNWAEDILGSVEVDGSGEFERGGGADPDARGSYQDSGTYRICTREGILGLSPFLMDRLRERLRELEGEMRDGRLRM